MRKFLLIFISMFLVLDVSLANGEDLVINCDYSGTAYEPVCTWNKAVYSLSPIRNCNELNNDPLAHGKILYIDNQTINECRQLTHSLERSGCQDIEFVPLNPAANAANIQFCKNNGPNVTINRVNYLFDGWSYAHKKCASSWGRWNIDTNTCDCDNLKVPSNNPTAYRVESIGNECICTGNEKTKYYDTKLYLGCQTAYSGIKNVFGTSTLFEMYGDFANTDHQYTCTPTGGEWTGITTNKCKCDPQKNLVPDGSGYFCNCIEDYDYISPTEKSKGCTPIENIPDYNSLEGTIVDKYNNVITIQISISGGEPELFNDGHFLLKNPSDAKNITFSDPGGTYAPITKTVPELKSNSRVIMPLVTSEEEQGEPSEAVTKCTETGGTPNQNGCDCDTTNNLTPTTTDDNIQVCKCSDTEKYTYDPASKSCKEIPQIGQETSNETNLETTVATDTDQIKKNLADAQKKLEDAREKQNSLGNRLVNAGASAAMGYGARMVATAMAEQSADAEAESDMREWIDTMKCEYGDGQVFNVGTETIYLPGGDEISEYAKEYKDMAGELKKTKAALGLKPGIESETIYDRADYDLYSYNPAERQSSDNVSVSRALMDSTSEDAIAWAEQKQESEQNRKIGTGVAIVGAVGGIGGNIAVNPDVRQKITDAFKKKD